MTDRDPDADTEASTKLNRYKGGAAGTTPAKLPTGDKPGDVLKYNWEPDEDGKMQVVGRLVRTTTGGALWQGKAPNHRPGWGRPPNEIRAEFRNSFDARRARLEQIIDDPTASARDVIAAMSLLGKIGVAAQTEHIGDKGQTVVILPAQREPEVLMAEVVEEDAPPEPSRVALPPKGESTPEG